MNSMFVGILMGGMYLLAGNERSYRGKELYPGYLDVCGDSLGYINREEGVLQEEFLAEERSLAGSSF